MTSHQAFAQRRLMEAKQRFERDRSPANRQALVRAIARAEAARDYVKPLTKERL